MTESEKVSLLMPRLTLKVSLRDLSSADQKTGPALAHRTTKGKFDRNVIYRFVILLESKSKKQ
jgi:hypothetical protein